MSKEKIKLIKLPDSSMHITGYTVFRGDIEIGEVLKQRGFSYRGSGGWNSGVRFKDFHPIKWSYCVKGDFRSWTAQTRKLAIEGLIKDFDESGGVE